MSASDSSRKTFSRAPNGCNAKPIWLSLRPSERGEIEQVANDLKHSVAATARLIELVGLEQYRAKGVSELYRVNEEDMKRHSTSKETF
ncbi:hypothetical protein ACM26W_01175 [Halomonas sp. HK25]|uniref:hypothetical protein n=1 Tax=Halomonas sp. HK25 TaxID=3394321 RepID=UPI0039FBC003